jgi:hypothetical protein
VKTHDIGGSQVHANASPKQHGARRAVWSPQSGRRRPVGKRDVGVSAMAMNASRPRLEPTCARLATLIRAELDATITGLDPVQGALRPCMYLYRAGRVEWHPLPPDAFGPEPRKRWVLSGLIPVLVETGGIQAVGFAFVASQGCRRDAEAVVMHALDADNHEAWRAPIRRIAGSAFALGRWLPDTPDSIDARVLSELERALRARSPADSSRATPGRLGGSAASEQEHPGRMSRAARRLGAGARMYVGTRRPRSADEWEGLGWRERQAQRLATLVAGTRSPQVLVSTGRTITPLRHHVRHSPLGFEWGYRGNGPSELARCILIDHLALSDPDRELPPGVQRTFAHDVIAELPRSGVWTLTSQEISTWLTDPPVAAATLDPLATSTEDRRL